MLGVAGILTPELGAKLGGITGEAGKVGRLSGAAAGLPACTPGGGG